MKIILDICSELGSIDEIVKKIVNVIPNTEFIQIIEEKRQRGRPRKNDVHSESSRDEAIRSESMILNKANPNKEERSKNKVGRPRKEDEVVKRTWKDRDIVKHREYVRNYYNKNIDKCRMKASKKYYYNRQCSLFRKIDHTIF